MPNTSHVLLASGSAPARRDRTASAPFSDPRQQLGALGERVAERWLRARGWDILNRRFRSGHRDLDLVVRQPGLVAFVEVKTRRGPAFGGPLEAVHWRKRRELARSAQVWIARHAPRESAFRFDVIGVEFGPGARPTVRVRHVADAFQVPS